MWWKRTNGAFWHILFALRNTCEQHECDKSTQTHNYHYVPCRQTRVATRQFISAQGTTDLRHSLVACLERKADPSFLIGNEIAAESI
jgi:hypothetical protein